MLMMILSVPILVPTTHTTPMRGARPNLELTFCFAESGPDDRVLHRGTAAGRLQFLGR